MQHLKIWDYNHLKSSILITIFLLILLPTTILTQGTIINDKVYSMSLEGNFLGDSPNRPVNIYLPPGYEEDQHISYPVIYLLHGFTHTQTTWLPFGNLNMDIKTILDNLITGGDIQPVIVIMPNGYNKYHGSWYTNSIVTGNWEDFIVMDLVEYIDANYRTLPHRESRGIAGHSMGGTGAFKIAMKHPDIFSAVYSLSAGFISFEHTIMGPNFKNYLISAANRTDGTYFDSYHWKERVMVAAAAAFAPDTNSLPFYGSFPVGESGVLIDTIWAKWLEHDPLTIFPAYKTNLLQLDSMWIECGTLDELYDSNYYIYQALDSAGIITIWDEYVGNHSNKIPQRIRDKMLPFFSATLLNVTSIKYSDAYTPTQYLLKQNYPNPFNPKTIINYELPITNYVELSIYNVLGQKVETLVSGKQKAGFHTVEWDASHLSSGVYYYMIKVADPVRRTGGWQDVKKMLLIM